jgi:putative DNA-invertase from lambdoid prophage Rac
VARIAAPVAGFVVFDSPLRLKRNLLTFGPRGRGMTSEGRWSAVEQGEKRAAPLRAALYGRVSLADASQDPESQMIPLREFAGRQEGWRVVGEFVDKAGSTDYRKRTEWVRLLRAARAGEVDVIAVWKLDRAFRSTVDALTTLRDLREKGVAFVSATEPAIDTRNGGSPLADLILTVLAAVAQFEKAMIAERTRAGMVRAKRAGKRIGWPKGRKHGPMSAEHRRAISEGRRKKASERG